MAPKKRSNSTIISISSSSEGEDEDNQCESLSESEFEISSDEDDEDYNDGEYSGGEDDDDDDYDGSKLDDQEHEEEDEELDYGDGNVNSDGEDNDERICDKVIRLAKERSDLQELNLSECKSYLRRHGLRLSGTKAECLQRINEHRRIKDESGEALYPRSSFSINCTGDVCKGDVVLFMQKVNEKFDTRRRGLLRKRTIAGRVVKESYGATKQQHTFTVEILWTKGSKKLPPLFPLLVKGRFLYKFGTFRQRWKNEAERSKVLFEKHRRGAAAREMQAMRKTKNASCINAGTKRQKLSHSMPSQKKQTTEHDSGKCAGRQGTVPVEHKKSNNHLQCPQLMKLNGPSKARLPAFQLNSYSSQNKIPREYHHQTKSQGFTYPNSYRNPGSEGFNHGAHLHHASHSYPRNFNQYPRLMNVYQPPFFVIPMMQSELIWSRGV